MKIKKTIIYEAKPILGAWDITMGDFLKTRLKNNMTTLEFERCFNCDHKFNSEEIPIVTTVYGVGNRFICSKCFAEYELNSLNEK